MKATRPGSAVTRTAPALRFEVRLSMTLIERKQKLIDKCIKIRSTAKEAYSPEDVSLAELMAEVVNLGRDDIYDALEYDENNPREVEAAKTWTLPGQPPRTHKKTETSDQQSPRPPP